MITTNHIEPKQGDPRWVTFTGIDERTDVRRVEKLSERYPVEWGVLYSRRNNGKSQRYPSLEFIEKFSNDITSPRVGLAAHICGAYAHEIVDCGLIDMRLLQHLGHGFELARIQINLHDGETTSTTDNIDVLASRAADVAFLAGVDVILQMHQEFPPDNVVTTAGETRLYELAQFLFDASGGAGVVPNEWAKGPPWRDHLVGYAGGLGPHNIATELPRIKAARGEGMQFWIDMETAVRTDEWLDLDKCEAVLKAVYGE